MDLELTGRTALVTGSSAGVGRAAAARLAAEGCSVLIHGRHQESADEAAAD
ncbi:MAG: SDR family NAD(P)-dependent oxidoreductase, partial [Aeromicrobium sp.]